MAHEFPFTFTVPSNFPEAIPVFVAPESATYKDVAKEPDCEITPPFASGAYDVEQPDAAPFNDLGLLIPEWQHTGYSNPHDDLGLATFAEDGTMVFRDEESALNGPSLTLECDDSGSTSEPRTALRSPAEPQASSKGGSGHNATQVSSQTDGIVYRDFAPFVTDISWNLASIGSKFIERRKRRNLALLLSLDLPCGLPQSNNTVISSLAQDPSPSSSKDTTPEIETPRDVSPVAPQTPDVVLPSDSSLCRFPDDPTESGSNRLMTMPIEIKLENRTPLLQELNLCIPTPSEPLSSTPEPNQLVNAEDIQIEAQASERVSRTSKRKRTAGNPDNNRSVRPGRGTRQTNRATHAKTRRASRTKQKIVCTICNDGKTFFNLQTRDRHIRTVHEDDLVSCPNEDCQFRGRMDSVLRHIRSKGRKSDCWEKAVEAGWGPRL